MLCAGKSCEGQWKELPYSVKLLIQAFNVLPGEQSNSAV